MPRNKLGYLIAANAMAYQGRRLYGHARWAYRTARGMYYGRNRKRVMRHARRNSRRYRKIRQGKRQRFGRSTFGWSRGSALTRRTAVSFNYLWTTQTRELDRYNLTNILSGGEINQRADDMIYMGGYKIRMQIRNPRSEPMMMHVAVVAPREYAGSSGSADARVDFFRDVNGTRGLDFSEQLPSMQLHSRGINTDRYHVFFHKRYTLGPDASGTPQDGGYEAYTQKNWRYINQWVPIKRQIRYEGDAASDCVNTIYMFTWSDIFVDEAGQTPRQSFEGQYEVIAFFKNSREN